MGQYFRIVNLDKREWIEPDGAKLWELCAGNAIRMLGYLLATDNPDGAGLYVHFSEGGREEALRGLRERFGELAEVREYGWGGAALPRLRYFGRWCGDRIAVVGDYAEGSSNYRPGVDGPSYRELRESGEWREVTEEVAEEFNWFIGEEGLRVRAAGRVK